MERETDMKAIDVPMRPVDHIFSGRRESIAAGVCMFCRGKATEFRDALSRKEYEISGVCQKCQDKVFD